MENVYIISWMGFFGPDGGFVPDSNSPDIRQVAALARVSIATVSRVFNNPSRVSPATREKVRAIAERVGYRPNPLGQRLRKGRTEAVGLVIQTPPGRSLEPFFLELMAGLGEGLGDAGLDLLVTTCHSPTQELTHYRRLVEGQRVDALVLARTRHSDERIKYLLQQDLPFVVQGRSDAIQQPFPYLDIDGEEGFFVATRYLLELGHRRIALIAAPRDFNFALHRLRGYRKALEAAAVPAQAEWVLEGDLSEESGYRLALELLSLPQPPTALLCANDLMALGALHALRERGLRAGREVSVIGYDDISPAHYTDPPLTTLRQPFRAMGRRLVEMLLARMDGVPAQKLQEVWAPELVIRGSVGPCMETSISPRSGAASVSPQSGGG
ncbi:transcriptional regulator, LacI family [Allomeiothermus silvanus DSM 9946]|uniref:Transcriptional regulator, LacI family n=2 Tax=Allomeiothermus silvanus TaxID=52022 RepID=D7BAR8_ALLS1|nr:transcriptional regulator, LacI family [Allomeiothermus silvanus DSM 9946]